MWGTYLFPQTDACPRTLWTVEALVSLDSWCESVFLYDTPDYSPKVLQSMQTGLNAADALRNFTSNAYFSSSIVCHSACVFALHTAAEFWIALLWMGKNLVRLKAQWDGGAWNSLGGAAVPALCPLQEDVHSTGFERCCCGQLWPCCPKKGCALGIDGKPESRMKNHICGGEGC